MRDTDLSASLSSRDEVRDQYRERPDREVLECGEQLAQIGSWEWNIDTGVLLWSDNMFRLLGMEPGSIEPSPEYVLGRVHPDDRARVALGLELTKREGAAPDQRYRTIWPDGTIHVLRSVAAVAEERDARPSRFIGTVQDITELFEAQRRTAESLTVMETLQSAAPVGFAFVDCDRRIVRINRTFADLNGGRPQEQIGRSIAEVIPDIWAQMESSYRRVLAGNEAVANIEIVRARDGTQGSDFWLASFYPVNVGDESLGVGVVVTDITERQEAEHLHAAVMDTMVEGLCVLDADGRLTFMNAAASRILGWSEDELRGTSMHAAIHAQRADGSPHPESDCELLKVRTEGRQVRMDHEAFTRKDGTIVPVAYSAAPLLSGSKVRGVVVMFRDTSIEQREEGRTRRELDTLAWIGRIRDALDQDRLVLYSQPIVPLADGQSREELLLRMVGQGGELILPGTFLPVAEKYGLIGEVDRWVIGEAARFAAEGRRVAVNLSAASVGNLGLLPVIDRELHNAHADPANVVFEITETALMENVELGTAFARGLSALGCRLALDDFGTGFGGFTYLKRVPVAYLKIDIEFVRNLRTDRANQHVVRAIVGLAKDFGYETIGEGVEDAETLLLLKDYGVDFAQGYHLGRPAPIDA